jgi:hypothetical protein
MINSFKGKPGTNLLVGPNKIFNGYSITNYSNGKLFETNGYEETVNIPALGNRTVQSVEIYNVYSGYGTDGNFNCCPTLFYYSNSWRSTQLQGNTLYMYEIIYKCDSGYTNPNYMYHYEYRADGTYNTEFGVHDESRRISLGDGWYYAWGSFTTQPTTADGTFGCWYYNYNVRDKLSIASISLQQGDSILPPRQLIPSNSTRSNTQGLLDLAGNYSLDLSNISFNSSGQMVFDGTNDCIIIPTSNFDKSNGQELTVEVIMKPGRNAGQYQDIVVNRSDGQYNWMLYQHATDGSIQLHGADQYKSSYIPTVGQYIHVVATVTSGQVSTLYVNGVVQQTIVGFSYAGGNPSLLCIGVFGNSKYEPYLGNIDIVKIYNRALTAGEVRQNYGHYKTRFNLP